MLLVDGVPQPQLRGDAAVEPLEDRESVAALRGGGQAEQLLRRDVVEQLAVRPRGCMVELVDDDDVEVVRSQRLQAVRVQALDRGEDVLVVLRSGSPDPLLTEGRITQRVAERRQGLVEDLLPVGHEQKTGTLSSRPQAGVVDRRENCLAGHRRGHHQVAPVPTLARHLHQLEQTFLVRQEAEFDRTQHDLRTAATRPARICSASN